MAELEGRFCGLRPRSSRERQDCKLPTSARLPNRLRHHPYIRTDIEQAGRYTFRSLLTVPSETPNLLEIARMERPSAWSRFASKRRAVAAARKSVRDCAP